MKGQKLFIRPARPDDDSAIRAAFGDVSRASHVYVAKLVGELAALASLDVADETATLQRLEVRSDIRRLRVGTKLLRDVATRLRQENVRRLTVRMKMLPHDFLTHVGFVAQNEEYVLEV